MIRFSCVKCGESMEVPSSMQGEREACPACKAVNLIPIDKESRLEEDALSSLVAVAKQNAAREPNFVPMVKPSNLQVQNHKAGPVSKSAYLRPGFGVLLLLAFFLPWLQVSCNQSVIMQPSGFNLLTGIRDAKTNGMLKMMDEMSKPPEFGTSSGLFPSLRTPPRSTTPSMEFSYWGSPNNNDPKKTEQDHPIQQATVMVSFYLYAGLILPIMLVLCGLLLKRLLHAEHNITSGSKDSLCIWLTILGTVAIGVLVVFGIAFKPSEIPPGMDMGLDWGYYLSVITLAAYPGITLWEKRTAVS